jgi:hypothetical protein
MGLLQIRNGQIVETRMIENDAEVNMTTAECRMYIEKLEKEIRELKARK